MARVPLVRLVALQEHRSEEIAAIGERIRARAPNSLNATIIQTRIRTVNELWAEIRSTHHDIMLRADALRHPYITEKKYDAMHRIFEELHDSLLTTLSNFTRDEERNPRNSRPRDIDEDERSDYDNDRPAKLPRLDLPSFSGKYEDWDSFADIFTTLVHNTPRIADTTKLQYLKSCLKGSAAELVKDVAILGVNYASTWKALRDRFHNPRLTVNKLLDSLNSLPYLKKESAIELRKFVDETQRIVRALSNLKAPVSHWDLWLVHLLETRIDSESRKIWESELIANERQRSPSSTDDENSDASRFPKFVDLMAFLEKRAQSLSVIHADREDKRVTHPGSSNHGSRRVHHAQVSSSAKATKCILCQRDHYITRCPTFLAKRIHDRQSDVRKLKLCFNCLGSHKFRDCKSNFCCKVQSRPRTRRIVITPPPTSLVRANIARLPTASRVSINACNGAVSMKCHVLLATAQVVIIGPHGNQTRARALLDQGSEATFVSESLAQMLGLQRDRVDTTLTGIGGCKAGSVKFATQFTMQSMHDPEGKFEVNAFILLRLTSEMPSRDLDELNLEQFKHLPLADPDFHISDRFDLLIGADMYGLLLRSGVERFPKILLVAQNTALGWIISGQTRRSTPRRAALTNNVSVKTLRCTVNEDLSELIQRFWTIEEVSVPERKMKPSDEACERIFVETHSRGPDGRYVVRLPLVEEPPRVATETRRIALGSLNHQYRRYSRDPKLEGVYTDFMETYIKLGHMERVPDAELNNPRSWYVPHHLIMRISGDQMKPRVVFNASRQTHEKLCLNDYLATGPALQSDLSLVLLNWRRYRYAFTADIVKMFRQIRVAPEDQDLQRVLWPPTAPLDYRLKTVTYGTACAPYLAIRTLLQLARDERERFPLGAECLEENTYVDDMFVGADQLSFAAQKRNELVGILKSAGIELDKWAANHIDLLPSRDQSNADTVKDINCETAVKTLGVHWKPSSDKFNFSASNFETDNKRMTKRSIYSEIARLFDPLGWLAPITVIAKLIMQDLWIKKCEWDEPLPADICERWQNYCQSLSSLPTLSISRWLGLSQHNSFEIHGFSDASSRAYAAAVYIRIDNGNGQFRVALLSAKTKVSPVKTVSIPNLELLGATLLVKLVCHLQKLEFLKNAPVRLWSDSQIVLMWLKKHPCHWKTFVPNRVSLIQTELPSATWAHVPTKQNPADLATRGALPTELKSSDLWWHGPSWLASHPQHWPQPPKAVQVLHTQPKMNEPKILSQYSTLTRLVRVTAWCLRPLLQLARRRAGEEPYPKRLTVADLDNARTVLVKAAQSHAFKREIALLQAGQDLPKRDPMCKLRPFLDKDGVLRVGGRLRNANLPGHVQCPPILPRVSSLSRLFVLDAHQRALHGGPTLTTSILLRFVWIVGMRPLVKTTIHKCIVCQRHKPRLAHQLMGNLPAARVNPTRPFTTTGLDYTGPFQLRPSKGRGQQTYKGYIALLVCFATKAIHLEAVSNLTTAKFIAAFRRFVSRRGPCKHLFSDNATNFRGADAELRGMFKAASEFYKDVAAVLADDGTSWTFIPPTTPHYGGLWEAGVKSTKNLLKKTIGEHTLTFEELSTVLAEIEACLNSRPLCPLTSDPEDLQVLTPSHFLIGTAAGVIPDEETPAVPENRLDPFQLMQRIRDQFWRRWSNEYVLQLQERGKWRTPTENFTVGQLVLLKDDRYPASKWPMGRVLEIHPGKDGLVRVVTVKTASNTLRRHIACLAPLTLDQPEDKEDAAKRGV